MTTDVRRPARLDRAVLVSNLVSGALWLVFGVLLAAFVVPYVLLASLLLAWTHPARWAYVVAWAGAVGLWVVLLASVGGGEGSPLLTGGLAVVLGSLTFLGWQGVALVVRHQFLLSRP